jgi:xanthine dehydrogenase/oxidase
MKSFALNKNPIDIEELNKLRCLNDNENVCSGKSKTRTIHMIQPNDSSEWFTPSDMDSLYKLLVQYQQQPYKLVSGNTGTGVYKNDGPYQVLAYFCIL